MYRRFTAGIIPMSRGWYMDVVLGGKRTMVTPSARSSPWDGALSITRYTG